MGRPTRCHNGHLYPPDTPLDDRGRRICLVCRDDGTLCRHCRLRPPSRKGSPFCSKACSNAARARPLADRFLDNFTPGRPDTCWPWTGALDRDGYGVISDEHHRQLRAPRVAYERVHGPIPEGLNVMHECDNPPCVNPNHLRLGTIAENDDDKFRKRRHSYGARHGRTRLTEQDVRDIRESYPQMSQTAIAEKYGLHQTTVSDIIAKRLWKHVR